MLDIKKLLEAFKAISIQEKREILIGMLEKIKVDEDELDVLTKIYYYLIETHEPNETLMEQTYENLMYAVSSMDEKKGNEIREILNNKMYKLREKEIQLREIESAELEDMLNSIY